MVPGREEVQRAVGVLMGIAGALVTATRHGPDQVWVAVRLLRLREAGEVRAC